MPASRRPRAVTAAAVAGSAAACTVVAATAGSKMGPTVNAFALSRAAAPASAASSSSLLEAAKFSALPDVVPQAAATAGSHQAAVGAALLAAGAGVAAGAGARGRRRAAGRRAAKVQPLARRAGPAGVYCETAEACTRRKTRTIDIGGVKVGSEHPVAVQTMTNTFTHDVEATVEQIKKCADAGADIVRVTVQGMREAKACEQIKKQLLEDGYTVPIVADIHFTPKVAMVVADHVDKVRVNPGNFTDGRKSFDTITELTEKDVEEALEDIETAFAPLVKKLKEQGKALRIGVNHGSLSERILFQYGDSPEGMVASAVEFGEICRKYDYHNFLFSMKSSNPQVMVQAYRALTREMYKRGWDYPLHLGVTEAGGGADGRIKSATGIGALLIDGIGDTIRVSLTEDPELECAPCKALRNVAEEAVGKGVEAFEEPSGRRDGPVPRRHCEFPLDVPLNSDGSVLTSIKVKDLKDMTDQQICDRFGLRLRKDGDIQKDWKSVDVVVLDGVVSAPVGVKLKLLLDVPMGIICKPSPNAPAGCTYTVNVSDVEDEPLPERLGGYALVVNGQESAEELEKALAYCSPRFILLKPESQDGVTFLGRSFFSKLSSLEAGKTVPVMFWFRYMEDREEDDIVVEASSEFGSLFIDGMGEGLLWDAKVMTPDALREASFNLLQASRMRVSKTEFISCPSCGRTLFNLQETTAKIQARTGHLPGVRIAVMGCIVNGPGEMADADFGYVGSGVGKVDLYVNYTVEKRAIPTEKAVDALVDLIKDHGKWQDPPEEEEEEEVDIEGTVVML